MADPTTKTELLAVIRQRHAELEALLGRLSDADMLAPGFNGDWTGKDILAHIVDWEQRFLRWYTAGKRGEPVERPEPGMTWDDLDRLNAQMIARNRDRALVEVRAAFVESYRQVLDAVKAMGEDEIFTVGRYAWTGEHPLLVSLRANTDWHYAEHISQIEAWIAAHKS